MDASGQISVLQARGIVTDKIGPLVGIDNPGRRDDSRAVPYGAAGIQAIGKVDGVITIRKDVLPAPDDDTVSDGYDHIFTLQ